MRVVRRLTYAILGIALVSLALTTGFLPLYYLAYALGVALAIALVWAWVQGRRLRVTLDRLTVFPQVGHALAFRVAVEEAAGMARLDLRLRLSGQNVAPAEAVVDLGRHDRFLWTGLLQAQRRGPAEVGSLETVTTDPLGLVRLQRRIAKPYAILVYPHTVTLPPDVAARYSGLWGEGEAIRHARESISASRVREYQAGDPLSRLHWPTTARRGQLMTKEFDSGSEWDKVWLFLDMRAATQAGAGTTGTEEAGVVIAASLTEMLSEAGKSVGLVAQGETLHRIVASRDVDHRLDVLRALALMRAEGDVPVSQVVAQAFPAVEQGSSLILIAPWPGQELGMVAEQARQRDVLLLPILLNLATFGQHFDARWLRNPLSEFPGGACLIDSEDPPLKALEFVASRLAV